jgi:hypothetical protein
MRGTMFATLFTSRFPHIGQSCRVASKASRVMEIERSATISDWLLRRIRIGYWGGPVRIFPNISTACEPCLCSRFTKRSRMRAGESGASREALLPADVEIATLKIARDAAIRECALSVRRIDGRRAMNIKQSGSTTEFYGCGQNPAVRPLLSRNVKKPWA